MAVGSTWPRLNWMSCSLNAQKAHEFPCTGKRKPFHHSKPAVLATTTIDWRFLYQDTRIKPQSLYPTLDDWLESLGPCCRGFRRLNHHQGCLSLTFTLMVLALKLPTKEASNKREPPFQGWVNRLIIHPQQVYFVLQAYLWESVQPQQTSCFIDY